MYPILLALRAGKRTFKTLWIQQRRGPVTVERQLAFAGTHLVWNTLVILCFAQEG